MLRCGFNIKSQTCFPFTRFTPGGCNFFSWSKQQSLAGYRL
jgi:hypothetical protein